MRKLKTLSSKKFQKNANFLPIMFYMDTNADSFWKRVNTLIKSQKTKQEVVAEKSGINYQTFRGWITNHRFPSGDETYRIAQALNTSVEYLVSGTEPGDSKAAVLNDLQAFIEAHR
jgi:transcriptional regulator with XRE-family HTH domain